MNRGFPSDRARAHSHKGSVLVRTHSRPSPLCFSSDSPESTFAIINARQPPSPQKIRVEIALLHIFGGGGLRIKTSGLRDFAIEDRKGKIMAPGPNRPRRLMMTHPAFFDGRHTRGFSLPFSFQQQTKIELLFLRAPLSRLSFSSVRAPPPPKKNNNLRS